MSLRLRLALVALTIAGAHAFLPHARTNRRPAVRMALEEQSISDNTGLLRREVLQTFAAALTVSTAPGIASARGRATQVNAWSRYGSRVEGFRGWLAGDLSAMIKTGDLAGIKEATAKKGLVSNYLS